jgi:hypothetical protein
MTDDLDSILDAALSEYSNPEPRPGLEQRILRNILAVPPSRRSWWWIGWVLTAVALALIAFRIDRTRAPQAHQISRANDSFAQQSAPIPSRRARSVREEAVAKNHKVRYQPTHVETPPEPMTPEERNLLRFAQSHPQQLREALTQSTQIEKLTIEPLRIEELP